MIEIFISKKKIFEGETFLVKEGETFLVKEGETEREELKQEEYIK